MAWIAFLTSHVLSEFTPNEAASIRNLQGSGSGPGYVNIDVITARTVDEVRGFILAGDYAIDDTNNNTLPKGLFADAIAIARWRTLIAAPQLKQLQTAERQKAYEDALAKMNKIADQQFNVEPPIPPASNFQAGCWNSENKLLMRTHPVPKPGSQFGPEGADDYANPDAPPDAKPTP
jgi:hypothetical protein